MIPYAKEVGGLLVLIALAVSHGCAWRMGGQGARAEMAEHLAKVARQSRVAAEKAREAERKWATAYLEIGEQYEQDKSDAQAKHDATVAAIRAGHERLRKHWRCPVPNAPAGAGEPDAAADDRAEGAGRIVRAAAECDAQVRGLQAIVRSWIP